MKAIKLVIILLALILVSVHAAESPVQSSSVIKIKSSGSRNDTAVINSLIRKGNKYLSTKIGGIDIIKTYIDSAILICEKRNLDAPAGLHLLLAEYHLATGDFRSASEEASIALKKSAGAGETDILAKTNFFLGSYYQRTGLFKESIEYYGNCISISKKNSLKRLIPESYWGQASVYNTIGDLKGYRQNILLMIEAGFAENDSLSAAVGYSRLGTSFCGDSAVSKRRNFRQADSLLKKSLKISLIRKDTSVTAFSLANIGWNFYLEKMYDSSLYNYERSLKYSLSVNLSSAAANSLGNIGTIYRDLGDPDRSIKFYSKAIDQAKKVNDIYNLQWIYMDMSNMYLKLKDTSNAYKTYVLYKKYSDSYIRKESSQGLADARLRFDADTRNKEVELLSLRLKNNRLLNYGFLGFIVLMLVIGLLLFRGSKLKDKRRISEMNRKISEITQANLRQQMNPHFIFNTLNSIQYYMYQHDKLATNNYLTKFSSLMRKVLDNSQHTSVPLNDELNALNLYLELESIRFKGKFDYKINVDEEIDPLMYKVPTMLIQPYVENSIRHGLVPGDDKGIVSIDLMLKDDHILCTIEDNGIGREAAKERNNLSENNHNSLGTRIAKSRLDLVNELYGTDLKTVYTDLKNESGEPAGTRVEIQIPIIT